MSRCYPYRPTTASRVRSGLAGEAALIETIKLQSEMSKLKADPRKEQRKEKPKTDIRKEQNMEKKEKRKDRKEKEKDEKCYQSGGCLLKGIEEEETERLEKSGVTDEHNEPTQNLCYLSDGTQGGNKRKRHPSPYNGITPSNGITVHRNIIRIRLPSQKLRRVDEEQSCSISGRAADSLDRKKESQTSNNIDVDLTGLSKYVQCGSYGSLGNELQEKKSYCKSSHGNELQGKESLYKTLIEDWVPLPLQCGVNDNDDQEWLFGTKHRTDGSKRLKGGDDVSCHQSHTSWPTAQYLLGANVYSLPYTIPF